MSAKFWLMVGIGAALFLIGVILVFSDPYYRSQVEKFQTLLTGMVALLLAGAALSQARTAALRHNAQTDADRQRHITESFSKAVEQLGSEKMEARLGGIYTLERISHESAAESERSA